MQSRSPYSSSSETLLLTACSTIQSRSRKMFSRICYHWRVRSVSDISRVSRSLVDCVRVKLSISDISSGRIDISDNSHTIDESIKNFSASPTVTKLYTASTLNIRADENKRVFLADPTWNARVYLRFTRIPDSHTYTHAHAHAGTRTARCTRTSRLAMQLCTLVLARRRTSPSETFGGSNTGGDTKRGCNRGLAQCSPDSVKYTLLSMPSARCTNHLCGKWNYKRIPSCGIPSCDSHLAFAMSGARARACTERGTDRYGNVAQLNERARFVIGDDRRAPQGKVFVRSSERVLRSDETISRKHGIHRLN